MRWMSRAPPRAKFTAKDWLAANRSDLTWIVLVAVGFTVAVLITSHPA
jgi:hypothetical protein